MRLPALIISSACLALSAACSDPATLTGSGGAGGAAGTAGVGGAGTSGDAGAGGSAGTSGGAGAGGSAGSLAGAAGGAGVSGSAGTPPAFASGLPEDTVLSSLSGDQLSSLCSSLGSYIAASSDAACRIAGVTAAILANRTTLGASDTLLQQVCQNTYDPCVQPSASTPTLCNGAAGDCNATNQQLEDCYSQRRTALSKTSFPACSALTVATVVKAGSAAPFVQPPECTSLQAACPAAAPPAN